MKNLIYLFFSLFLLSCSDDGKIEDESSTAVIYPAPVELTILNANGEKVFVTGEFNREDVVVEMTNHNDVFIPDNEIMDELFCEEDLSGILLPVYNGGKPSSFYTVKFRITFPNTQVYLVEVDIDKTPNLYAPHWFNKTIRINGEVVYEGDVSEPGEYCHESALKLNLVLNQ